MPVQDGSELVRYVVENIVNTGQLVSVPEYLTPDYSLHKTGLSVPAGPEAFKMAVRQWRSAFPDYHLTVEATIAEGDLVACRYIATGTHRGSLMGMPASGRGFAVHGTDVHRLVDGRIAESWLADDIARLLHDLGLLRPVASGSWT
ncbi:ester cyclase [Actinoplanes sp. NPDC051411]|uniref:ester cyclase n=1 Tax=Actinoplanes sp. NPDC051411 TaxID=3155522 RepID=UPI003419243B